MTNPYRRRLSLAAVVAVALAALGVLGVTLTAQGARGQGAPAQGGVAQGAPAAQDPDAAAPAPGGRGGRGAGAGGRRPFSWETRVTKTAETYGVPDLEGTWAVVKREKPVNAAICDKHTDVRGLPRNPCRFNADLLNLTARANAWLVFHDERIEGKYYCVPESVPSVLVRDYPLRIEQRAGRVVFEHQITIHNNATRVAYLDGRSKPDAGDVPQYYGYSVGRYEGKELVVESSNFTFDPNGIDYMTNIPSSWRKKVTERYSRIADDRVRLVLSFEDPEMMKGTYTETLELIKVNNYEIIWTHCDPVAAYEDINMLPPKYKD